MHQPHIVHNFNAICDFSSSTLLEEDLYLSSDEEVTVPESQVRNQSLIYENLTCIREADIVDEELSIQYIN